MKRPFRTEPHTLSEEELALANEGRQGEDIFLPAEEEIEILRERPNPESVWIRRWKDHPDERVPAAFVLNLAKRRPLELLGSVEEVQRRALAEAKSEKVLWTPLVDAVAQHRTFQSSRRGNKHRRARARLGEWASRENSPLAILSVLEFHDKDVHREVIAHAAGPALTTEVLRRFLNEKHCPRFVAENPNLQKEQQELLAEWAVARLSGSGTPHLPSPPDLDDNGASTLIKGLAERGYPLSAALRGKLRKAFQKGARAERTIVNLILDYPELTSKELGLMIFRYGVQNGWIERIAAHPAMQANELRSIFGSTPQLEVRILIAALPQAQADVELRRAVLADSSVRVLASFFAALPEEERRRELEALLAAEPKRALELLRKISIPEGFIPSPEVLLRLLSHQRPELRLLGIQLSARREEGVQEKAVAAEPAQAGHIPADVAPSAKHARRSR